MSVPVLICRAQPGADETAERVAALGLTPIVTPSIQIVSDPDIALPDLATVSGLVFTSANGVREFSGRNLERGLTAWCVGPATALAAREAGFADVQASAGDSEDLAAFILEAIPKPEKPLLHIANRAASGRLSKALKAKGYALIFCPLYLAEPVNRLTAAATDVLNLSAPKIVLLHSKKGAEAFFNKAAGFDLSQLSVVAISELAAGPARSFALQKTKLAKEPNETALMTALQETYATLSA